MNYGGDSNWRGDAGSGRFRATLARMFGDNENPLGWAVSLGSVAGIRIRLSIWFIIFAVGQLIWSIAPDSIGLMYASIAMGVLFAIVLLHEFGHCFACRLVGGEADDILLWPLGGLASCAPPDNWKAHLVTTVGGPAVNLLILPMTCAGLWAIGRSDLIIFNPLRPGLELTTATQVWHVALFFAHYLNAILFAFNVFLPMFPLDGGRIVQEILWARLGRRESMRLAVNIGLVAAIVLAVLSLPARHTMILGIAIFCGLVCYVEKQRLRAEGDISYLPPERPVGHAPDPEQAARRARRESKARARAEAEQAEIDSILAKIADSGMGSLSTRERRRLQQATKKQRGD